MHGCYEMMLHNPEVDEYFGKNVHHMLNRANSIVYTAEKNKEILLKYNLTQDKKVHKIDNGFELGSYSKKNRKDLEERNYKT